MPKRTQKSPVTILMTIVAMVVLVFLYSEFDVGNLVPAPSTPTLTPTVEITQPAVLGTITDCEVFFTNPTGQVVDVRNPEEGILELINGAQSTIDMAAFEFDLVSMKDALAKAWYRGVAIRVVYDNEYSDKDLDMKELLSLGIKGIPDERGASMHNKFLIVDGKTVWTGSFNFSENAAHKNYENAMRIDSSELAKIYTQEFEKMFAGKFGPKKAAGDYAPLTICGNAPAEVHFSPRGPKEAILAVLSLATKSIHVMAYSFTDNEMGQMLLDKFKAGADVGAIFETFGSDTDASEFGQLKDGPRDCTDASTTATFHHKVMIVDGVYVIFGSYNFCGNAEESNDENLLIIESPAIAAEFEKEYQRRLAESMAANLCL